MNTVQSTTARALNADYLASITRAVALANRLDDLGEPFPIISDFRQGSIHGIITIMEAAIAEIEELEEMEVQP